MIIADKSIYDYAPVYCDSERVTCTQYEGTVLEEPEDCWEVDISKNQITVNEGVHAVRSIPIH